MKIALALFTVVMIWPPVHMWVTSTYEISPWRLFGWGMYSTPHKSRFASLRIIFTAKLTQEELERIVSPKVVRAEDREDFVGPVPSNEAAPVEVYVLVGQDTYRVPIDGRLLLGSSRQRVDFNRMMEFSSSAAMLRFIGSAKQQLPVTVEDKVYAVITRQRLSLLQKKLYTSNRIYQLRGGKLDYKGTVPLHKKTLGKLLAEIDEVS